MSFLKVKRFRHLEDLIAEANLIRGIDSSGAGSDEYGADLLKAIDSFDSYLDGFLDKVIDPKDFKDIEVKRGKQLVETYLDYCKKRLVRIAERLQNAIETGGESSSEVKSLSEQQFNIAKKISLLDDIYASLMQREDEEVRQIADGITKKIAEIQGLLTDSYVGLIETAGKKNFAGLEKLAKTTDPEEKTKLAEEIVATWQAVEIVSNDLPAEQQSQLERLKAVSYDKVSDQIGADRFNVIQQGAAFNREEAVLLERIVQLNYRTFRTQKELESEIADLRIKINSLHGETARRKASSPETIKYMTDLVDQTEAVLIQRFADKSLDLDKAKGIHFDFNVKLKLHESVSLPVTGKQIADSTTIMKLRKAASDLLGLLFGGGSLPSTPAGQAWADFGERVHLIYAKTLNTAAKAAGRLVNGREGEMKADALSRLFIPGTAVVDKTSKATFEDTAPGVSAQVPGSIGGMGAIVAPTPTSIGSGDNFNPPRKKKSGKKDKRVLEFNDFVTKFLK